MNTDGAGNPIAMDGLLLPPVYVEALGRDFLRCRYLLIRFSWGLRYDARPGDRLYRKSVALYAWPDAFRERHPRWTGFRYLLKLLGDAAGRLS
jgi:hypothetical protein